MTQSPARHYPFLDDPFPDHPYAALFPLIPDDELQELAKSIKADGQITPLVIYQGRILDGRNRYRAISLINSQLGDGDSPIALKYGNFLDGQTGPQADYLALKLVENTNLHRRNLTVGQKAMIAKDLAKFYSEIAKEERRLALERESETGRFVSKQELEPSVLNSGPSGAEARSAYKAAKERGIGRDSVVKANAIEKASPELAEEVRNGKMTLNAAYNQIKPSKITPVVPIPSIPDDSEQLSKEISDDFIKNCDLIIFAHIKLCVAAIAKHHPQALKEWS